MVEIVVTNNQLPPGSVTSSIPAQAAAQGIEWGKYLPWILLIIFLGIVLFFIWKWVEKGGKIFKKDYDKEFFKARSDFLSRDKPRTPGNAFWFIVGVGLIFTALSAGVTWVLYFFKIIPALSATITAVVAGCAFGGAWIVTTIFPATFTSYPKAIDRDGKVIGFMLSEPKESPDGFLDVLVFKKMKWILFKDIEIVSVFLNKQFTFEIKDPTDPQGKRSKKFSVALPGAPSDRYKIMPNGDLKINAISFFKTRYFIYPIPRGKDGDIYDFSDVAMIREKAAGDRLSLFDVANEFRESAYVIAGANPSKRLEGDSENRRKGDDE